MTSDVFVLTGPIGSGKTTRLIDWASGKNELKGIATPVVRGKRMFFDFNTQAVFPMEASGDTERVLEIGRFRFSRKAFDEAISILEKSSLTGCKYLVIDEIGPLELKGEGFHKILKKILNNDKRNFNLVLVIREGIFQDVLAHYYISDYKLLEL